jgi:hypothetical protein
MGAIVTERHDIDSLAISVIASELPHDEESDALFRMWREGRMDLWQFNKSWLVVEHLDGDAIGVPYTRGTLTDLEHIFRKLASHYKPQGKYRMWVRGRPGWGRVLSEFADARVHSVCYEIKERAH